MAGQNLVIGTTEFVNRLISIIPYDSPFVEFRSELMELKRYLDNTVSVTSNAERRQVDEPNVILPLQKLKQGLCDAEIELDQFFYEVLRRNGKKNGLFREIDSLLSCNPFGFQAKMAHKVKNIHRKLENSVSLSGLPLHNISGTTYTNSTCTQNREVRYFMSGNLDEDKSKLIDLLIGSSSSSSSNDNEQLVCEKFSVVLIVGEDGSGRTKLAQHVYDRIKDHFDIRIRVTREVMVLVPRTFPATVPVPTKFPKFPATVIVPTAIPTTSPAKVPVKLPKSFIKLKIPDTTPVPGQHMFFGEKVSAAKKLDLDGVLRKILESIEDAGKEHENSNRDVHVLVRAVGEGGKKYENSNHDVLVRAVREGLRGKKFMLVLHDIIIEESDNWVKLKSCLMFGSEGSKILVTQPEIAQIIEGVLSVYQFKQLPTDDCWSIIKEIAFSPDGASENPRMLNIGREIARKCCGLPFAARILGKIMYSKKELKEWASIRETEIMSDPDFHSKFYSTIKLSYDHLSPAVKQCFSYCSIFPRGWEIDREDLIQLWMAEGLIYHEDTGNEYFDCLLCSSLFQNVGKSQKKYKMNDLVHYLAGSVAGDYQCSISKAKENLNISEDQRLRLVFDKETPKIFPEAGNKLRTFFSIEVGNCDKIERVFDNRKLRVLYLSGLTIRNIPASISKLRHLRYLNLSRCYKLDVLSDQSVGSLFNLQTLILHNCVTLAELPESIGSLRSLRHLDLSYTGIKVLPESVTGLGNLRTLDVSHCTDFKALPQRIGDLKELWSLDVSYTKVGQFPYTFQYLTKLENLRLHSCPELKSLPSGIEKTCLVEWN